MSFHITKNRQEGQSAGKKTGLLDAIGNTPLVRFDKVSKAVGSNVYGKLEFFNPGLSAKDRIARYIVEKAEQNGKLKPGYTLVEATSGNTGLALAMIARAKGYKCILTLKDSVSSDKIDVLRLIGAEVIICPSKVKADDPRSYYEQAKSLAASNPTFYYTDQNYNLDNQESHYASTGPEIWEQSQGQITHLVAAVGTGGTCCGTAQYLKEKNPDIKVIGVDAYGSVLKKYHETGQFDPNELGSYKMDGVGKKIIPANVDFDVIDEFVKVWDKDAAWEAREFMQTEGMIIGHSSGAVLLAIKKIKDKLGPQDNVVAILPDHGMKYYSTIFNDQWMEEHGFNRD